MIFSFKIISITIESVYFDKFFFQLVIQICHSLIEALNFYILLFYLLFQINLVFKFHYVVFTLSFWTNILIFDNKIFGGLYRFAVLNFLMGSYIKKLWLNLWRHVVICFLLFIGWKLLDFLLQFFDIVFYIHRVVNGLL